VPPLVGGMRSSLNPKLHPSYKNADAAFFITEADGDVLARVGVIHNHRHNAFTKTKKAFFCFFESVDDTQAAAALFDAGFDWAKNRGLNMVIGPRGLIGSAAQSKIQRYPGDADYFERVNIIANTKKEACSILADIMRERVEETRKGPTYEMIEIKFGSYPQDVRRGEELIKSGSPISWKPSEALAGVIEVNVVDGDPLKITWEDASLDPGWCKLDWVVADPVHEVLVNASNMLDVTWQAPDGGITPLDGYLDPYFQEVYLEAESIPLFTKLAKHVSADALDDYVLALEKEVKKYISKTPNFGKAARRMYNIFRLTGRYEAAAYIRELFDEPTTVLYQVWSLIRTIDDTFTDDPRFSKDELLNHMDKLITNVIEALEGAEEVEVVRLLLRLRDILSREESGKGLSPQAEAVWSELINIVNNFFYEKLTAIPDIKGYMDEIAGGK